MATRPSESNRLRRGWAYVFAAVLIAAVLWPVLRDPSADSFPFSTYPMFSGRQSSAVSISHLVAIDAEGHAEALPPEALGTGEVIQAFESVRQAIRQGDASVSALCADAAAWASKHREDAVSIAVLSDSYDGVAYFSGDKQPTSTVTHGSCEVPR